MCSIKAACFKSFEGEGSGLCGEEVVESGWFDRGHLPEIPRPGSIARRMLDAWVAEGNA